MLWKRFQGVAVAALVVAAMACCVPRAGMADELAVDYAPYADLLARRVKDGLVDYRGLKADEAQLDRFLADMSAARPEFMDRYNGMAYYINAYNAWTLKLILTHYPGIDSIKDIGGFFSSPWKKDIASISGKDVSLDHIENDILRKQFNEPRIHFVINCASMSCPPLLGKPYEGHTLDQQLEAQTRAFIGDTRHNFYDARTYTLYLSKLFDWYEKDFGDVKAYVLRYMAPAVAEQVRKDGDTVRIRHTDYDWSLNEAR